MHAIAFSEQNAWRTYSSYEGADCAWVGSGVILAGETVMIGVAPHLHYW
jgi:hypothetical protein